MEKFINAVAILLRRLADGQTDGAYLGGRRCVGRVYNALAVTGGDGHMPSEKSQRTQNHVC